MKNLYFGTIVAVCLITLNACFGNKKYTVVGTVDEQSRDTLVLMLDLNGDILDSARIENCAFRFAGEVEKEQLVYVGSSSAVGIIALEPGKIEVTVDGRDILASGTPLNDDINAFQVSCRDIENSAMDNMQIIASMGQTPATDSLAMIVFQQYNTSLEYLIDSTYEANPDNLVGVFMMALKTSNVTTYDELMAFLEDADPYILNSELIQQRMEILKNEDAAADMADAAAYGEMPGGVEAGQGFIDFTGIDTATGDSVSLSDYVGKGVPVLVDFWASWCGPCQREMPTVKAIADKYAGKVKVIGVGVGDTPDNHKAAVQKWDIAWPQILDINEEAVMAYNVQAIPFMILFAGDGTVYRQNLRGEAVDEAVQELLER